MNTYTVIWRDAGDDFMFTEVTTAVEPAELTTTDWVIMAGEVEYAQWDDVDRVAALADLLEGYDLLDVLVGTPQSALVG
jgi:hypothetical protein